MKNIEFINVDGVYQAEIKVSACSAIHIERQRKSSLSISKSHTVDGEYSPLKLNESIRRMVSQRVLDFTLDEDVYPVYVRLISTSPVDKAYGSDSITIIE